jgi:hypothetical protein
VRLSFALGLAVIVAGGCAAAVAPVEPVGPLVMSGQRESGGAAFLGSAACSACHPAAAARWRATGHAREFAGLAPADRQTAACLRCHVTGYGDRLGYRSAGEGPDLANVGCEACHGPGADHGRSVHPELVPTLTGGECPPCEVNRICRLCHTPERSAGFDLAPALDRVTCKP